ncbi:MAG: flagellar basal body P-ring formation chaperone FlgA [Planctomycetaceae bacterium]|nr:flagellar basal body P-ring formation chaperone FlgA [Planctomycetaceae bacterium]
MCRFILFLFMLFLLTALSVLQVSAAEIRLKKGPVSCTGNLVMLDDIAEIIPNRADDNIERLRQTVLFSAPQDGEQRTITAVDLRNLFARIGIKSIEHQVTGSMKTVITSGAPIQNPIRQANYLTPSKAEHNGNIADNSANNANSFIPSKLIQTLETQVAEAVSVYLDSISEESGSRKVDVKLNAEQAHRLATSGKIVKITGGAVPFTGKQQFEIQMSRADALTHRNVSVRIDAEITRIQNILVASRALPKGHIINESDLTLTAIENSRNADAFNNSSAIIGMETTSTVREKSVLSPGVLKRPTWVRKGDVVTVRSINNGIIVRTNGIAQEDGAENDIVLVSILDTGAVRNQRLNRKNEQPTFTARVSQPKTVEVYAGAMEIK